MVPTLLHRIAIRESESLTLCIIFIHVHNYHNFYFIFDEQYKENVPKWNSGCDIATVSTDITTLESTIHQHQTLYEGMCQAYTEVHSTSKKLLYQLDHLVQLCKQPNNDERKHVRTFIYFCTVSSLFLSPFKVRNLSSIILSDEMLDD